MAGENSLFVSKRQIGQNSTNGSSSNNVYQAVSSRADQRSPRFVYWFAFFVISVIVSGTAIETTDSVHPNQKSISNQKYAVACGVTSFILSLIAVMMHTSPITSIFFVNTKVEAGALALFSFLWCILVTIVTDAGNGLAVDREGAVVHGNLYYSSWVGLACIVHLCFKYAKEVHYVHINEELSLRSERVGYWIFYVLCSMVLLVSGANVYDYNCLEPIDRKDGGQFCTRTILVMSNAALGSASGIVMVGMKLATGMAPWCVEMVISIILFILNSFALGLVTSEDGPGSKVGNIFYFCWICLVVSFLLLSVTYEYVSQKREEAEKEIATSQQYEISQQQQQQTAAQSYTRVNSAPAQPTDGYPSGYPGYPTKPQPNASGRFTYAETDEESSQFSSASEGFKKGDARSYATGKKSFYSTMKSAPDDSSAGSSYASSIQSGLKKPPPGSYYATKGQASSRSMNSSFKKPSSGNAYV
mmetsp:Transcript_6910/g.10082  ORF Transcript_6910/g.10082 Transcript_6910/m.10082 type:complete len:473 (+) Transcript_6910:112-1530(+)|eukprot:CAMPEP_0194204614 /NCGR_PEP_ID=MMETSP0156-20130528/4088_1 /TAXON_ID=33649 /ORGANISM="Thalassionema nitzschioides, Strain L26-B" /LENGTH=472 /DNA_ID=CAMNT_0038930671 /DNA_START=105 /DNA_END=1523 /DNA_ORIENTATION=-